MRFLYGILALIFCASCQTAPTANAPQTPPRPNSSASQFFLPPSAKQLEPTPSLPGLSTGALSILQGATDQNTTVLSVMVPINKKYVYTIMLDKTLLRTPPPVETVPEDSPWKIVNILLTGLHPGATYTLKVFNQSSSAKNDKSGDLVDERYFKTLPKDILPKIAVISCTSDSYKDIQKKQWQLVTEQNPDLLFMIGDNVYVDNNGPPASDKDIWRRYQETRLALDLYKLKTLIPVFATWDDHDFGFNNANGSFLLKEESKNVFQTFFPTVGSSFVQKGPGVSSYFEHKKNHYLFLDNRYFRTEKNKTSGDSHFGKEQEDWILKIISKRKGVFWLISGDQFFGGYHNFESYQGDHPQSFKNFLKKLSIKKKIVLFISGDRHIAELIKVPKKHLGYTTYELTSSGLHTKMYPGSLLNTPNADAVFNKDGELNFLILEPKEASKYKMRADVHFFGEAGRSLYNGRVEIQR